MTLLICSILSVSVVGMIGAVTGRNALRQVEADRLTELRESQRREVEALFKQMTNSLIVYSGGFSIVQALESFTAGFNQLASATTTPAQQQALVNYYDNDMIKPIQRITGETIDINAVLPSSNAQKYVQANYTAPPRPGPDKLPVVDAGDGSAWSAANAHFDFYMRGIVTRFDYRDVLLLDTQGNIVYTVNKGPDLGTNVLTGPYRESKLRDAYQKALRSNDVDFVWITDFQPYQPALDAPIGWVVSPIGMNGKVDGVMAWPLPTPKINRIMTADKQWDSAGLGSSTESYLVGPDNLMRSDSRLFLEDPQEYRREAVANGTPPDEVDRAIQLGTTILLQPVPSAGVRAAQRGQTGTVTDTDYTGNREMEAYAPLNVPNSDLHWSILVTRDDSAAFARLGRFSKTLVVGVAAMIFTVCVASMLLAQLLLRPVRRLQAGTQKISSGDYEVSIPVTSHDEIGDLTAAFNEMSRNLAIKEELLAEQRKENDRLLLALMPESVVQRYREGAGDYLAEAPGRHHHLRRHRGTRRNIQRSCPATNWSGSSTIFSASSIRRPKPLASNGFAPSTTVIWPAAGSSRRDWTAFIAALNSPSKCASIIDRFNGQTGHELRLRVGINTGNVVSGLVGRSSLVYDMWGAAVSLAYRMHSGAPQPGVYVSVEVYQALHEVRQFTPAGTISVGGVDQPIYRLSER